MRGPNERLKDMLDAIARIERYAARGREAFEQEELIQVWFFASSPAHRRGSGATWQDLS
jgi:hypothetical protein